MKLSSGPGKVPPELNPKGESERDMGLDVELIVFDWDGTLMDSADQIVTTMQAAIADLGLAPRDAEAIRNIIALGLREAVAALYPGEGDALVRALAARYREHWLANADHSRLFPGVVETLGLLHDEGFRLAVATGKGRAGLDKALAATGLGPLFHATRCADETESKPHPRMLLEIMDRLSVAPERTLMIGDTEYDMLMARRAGTHPVAVSYGVHAPERLQAHAPLTCLDRITELGDWLAECTRGDGQAAETTATRGLA